MLEKGSSVRIVPDKWQAWQQRGATEWQKQVKAIEGDKTSDRGGSHAKGGVATQNTEQAKREEAKRLN